MRQELEQASDDVKKYCCGRVKFVQARGKLIQ
jgi:hypothetical protein